jgi:hypothetical protein
VGEHLRNLLSLAFREPSRNEDALRAAVRACARDAKAQRRAPENVMVALKRAIADAAVARFSYRACNEMTDRVVRWFIDAYYEDAMAVRPLEARPASSSMELPAL